METVVVLVVLFIGFPMVLFHYITKWKTAATITTEDEKMLDELNELAHRLDDRLATVERIMSADNPNWRAIGADPTGLGIESSLSSRKLTQ